MTKVLATGIVENLSFSDKEKVNGGGTYQVANLTVSGKVFTGIFSRPRDLRNGMSVSVIENPPSAKSKYPQKEIVLNTDAPVQASTVAPSQPSRSPSTQDVISRQWAVSQAIQFVTLLADKGAIPAKALSDKTGTMLTAMVGQYANLWFNTVQTGANFEALPQFTGMINEEQSEREINV